MPDKPLKILNLAVLLQQQRYIIAISYLFYLHNGLTFSDFLLFQSIFYFTGLIAEIPAGYIGDIFPRKNILIFSYLLFMLRIIMWIIAPNYYTILLGEILYGLSKAFYRGVSDGYIYDYLKEFQVPNLMLNKYGKFNFYMSMGSAISCLLGAWLYQYFGFSLLLIIELFCNSTAVILLLFLPKISQSKISNISFKKHLKTIFNTVRKTVLNQKLNTYMLYSGLLTGITSVFVWNFQPFMKRFELPIVLFGLIYFINHLLRALGAINSKYLINKFSLQRIGLYVWILYLACFLTYINIMNYNNKYICILALIFICVSIGIEMVFNIGNLSRIHQNIISKTRATISSFNSMLASLFSGLFLMLFKTITSQYSITTALTTFVIFHLFLFIVVNKIIKKA